VQARPPLSPVAKLVRKLNSCDPKGGELCLGFSKSGESLMEEMKRTDVQIVVKTWVQGRKTHRTA